MNNNFFFKIDMDFLGNIKDNLCNEYLIINAVRPDLRHRYFNALKHYTKQQYLINNIEIRGVRRHYSIEIPLPRYRMKVE